MSAPKEPKTPKEGYEPLGEHDPCDHAYDYIDGDMDDYTTGDDYDNADTQERDYGDKKDPY